MSSRYRYEAVPNRDQNLSSTPISLSSLSSASNTPTPNTSNYNSSISSGTTYAEPSPYTPPAYPAQNYNFNSGLPNSIPPSRSASIASIPSSPPPSFHTHSSPGTPRPVPSTMTANSGQGAELWGVAPSTISGLTGESTSNDALATIAGLKQRVEWLEESIGRLLLEKERQPSSSPHPSCSHSQDPSSSSHDHTHKPRDNCCMILSSSTPNPDLESALTNGRNNCCVFYRSTEKREKVLRGPLAGVLLIFLLVVGTVFLFTGVHHGHGGPEMVGQKEWAEGLRDAR
ncbi:hypothetical protein BGZ60DRAFT_426656 [Tricladium varicosporioides]|nr:hypothetical protein BGZ60DRAFT_426656 [Hymenoscyphus varicosporioides]